MSLRLATRGSNLALWQAERTRQLLGGDAELVIVRSSGDRDRTTDLARFGSIGIFTVEVDRRLLDGEADIGVHSMKDMTTTLQDGIVLAGVLERGVIEDALVARDGLTLDELPAGSKIGTGSLRRGAMLRAARPDLDVVQLRGNVPTRVSKVIDGEIDAAILARAGLVRLGLEQHISDVLDTDRFLPAVGQGIVGLTCREDDAPTIALLAERVRDAAAWAAALAERSFLRAMKGGCNAPVGGHAAIEAEHITLTGRVLSVDGTQTIDGSVSGTLGEAEDLGLRLAADLGARGGHALVDEARASLA